MRVPQQAFQKLSASQKQYWQVKSKYMDVLLFFKVGKFYELYEDDAQAAHDVLDWKLTVTGVGQCRQVGCPESGLQEAVKNLVNAGACPDACVHGPLAGACTPALLWQHCIHDKPRDATSHESCTDSWELPAP
jgi:hypothetical protein